MNSENKKEIFPNRPQEPVKPYPYYEEEVAFDNKAADVRLAGTFTVPQGPGPFPAVLLVAGSGPHARDAIKCGHKTMLVLADHLTRHGVAVLRFDKRGCGDSTGNFEIAATIDFAGDAQAGIEYLKSRQEVNQEQIGLIGHSEGGIIASMIAADRTDLAFIILMASTGVNGEEVLLEQCALLARASGETDEAVTTRRQLLSRMCSCIHEYHDVAVAKKHIHDVYARYANSLSADQQKALSKSVWQEAYELMVAAPRWLNFFLSFDPASALRKIKIPVLALFCERDLLVPISQNLAPFKKALEDAGNKDVTIVQMPGLNHRFMHCQLGTEEEYAELEETMAPEALTTISTWIAAKTKAAVALKADNVFFNHMNTIIDDDTYNEIKNSVFLKDEFCHCQEQTSFGMQDGVKISWNGFYLTGESTYLEFFSKKDQGHLHAMQVGNVGIGLSVDRKDAIEAIIATFKQKFDDNVTHGLYERKLNNTVIPWFYYVVVTNMLPQLDAWIMAYHKDYCKNLSGDSFTRRDYNERCHTIAYDKNKLFKDIEEIMLLLSDEVKTTFIERQLLLGYTCQEGEDCITCRGPGITFKLKASAGQTCRLSSLRMSLNRPMHTPRVYTFGNSTLEICDEVATWTFR